MFRLGPWELGIILVIVLAIFGAGKLASLGGALGKGVRDFRKEMKTGQQAQAADAQDKASEGEADKPKPAAEEHKDA